jgi:asparagine synthetase B (glutamine-hydrolysing)
MCGFAGIHYADPSRSVNPDILRATGRSSAPRGSDAEGFLNERRRALAHRRLSIFDHENGLASPIKSTNSRG